MEDVTTSDPLLCSASEFKEENVKDMFNSGTVDLSIIDYSSIPYLGTIKDVPTWEKALKISAYIPIINVSMFGNFMVILVVLLNKRMRSTTNFYIVNLAVSDLLVTISCTWVHLVDSLTEGWVLGGFFCKFNSFAQVLSLVSSILTLTLIACDRFFGIVFAMKAHIIERKAWYTIMTVWICAVAVAMPLLFIRKYEEVHWADHVESWCSDYWPVTTTNNSTTVSFLSRRVYWTFISAVLFFLPVCVMSIAYSKIMYTLLRARVPGERINADVHLKSQNQKKKKNTGYGPMLERTRHARLNEGARPMVLDQTNLHEIYYEDRLPPALSRWVTDYAVFLKRFANLKIL